MSGVDLVVLQYFLVEHYHLAKNLNEKEFFPRKIKHYTVQLHDSTLAQLTVTYNVAYHNIILTLALVYMQCTDIKFLTDYY